jgi:hypothetical protein
VNVDDAREQLESMSPPARRIAWLGILEQLVATVLGDASAPEVSAVAALLVVHAPHEQLRGVLVELRDAPGSAAARQAFLDLAQPIVTDVRKRLDLV